MSPGWEWYKLCIVLWHLGDAQGADQELIEAVMCALEEDRDGMYALSAAQVERLFYRFAARLSRELFTANHDALNEFVAKALTRAP